MRINGVNYHVESVGDGEPLVLLHGFTGSSVNWREHVDVFAQHYNVITVDLLGHGKTDSPNEPERYAMEYAAADLSAIFDAAAGEPVNLLGYSMGGRLALYTAIHYPEQISKLILESSSPGLRIESERVARRQQDNALADRIERDGIGAFVDFWETLSLWESQKQLPDESRAMLRAQRLRNNQLGLANSLRGMGTGVQPSLWNDLGGISPLLITGEYDVKFNAIAAEMMQLLPNAQHVVIPEAGHTTHLEEPDAFQEMVLGFLRGDK